MRKRIEWEGEVLSECKDGNNYSTFTRMKVIGGWLVIHSFVGKNGASESMIMVPDRDHEWEILIPKADPVIERSAIAKDFEPTAN